MLNRDPKRFRGLSGEETLAFQVIEQAANAGEACAESVEIQTSLFLLLHCK